MYIKKLFKVILVSIISAIISAVIGHFIFEGDWLFVPFPLLAGLCMILTQKEKVSYKFLDKLIVGSLLFGFATMFFIVVRMHLIGHSINPAYSFSHYFNYIDYLTLSLVFSFVSFMGGLVGIVVKGFYFLDRNNKTQQKF